LCWPSQLKTRLLRRSGVGPGLVGHRQRCVVQSRQ
jgi:hypothetical protein